MTGRKDCIQPERPRAQAKEDGDYVLLLMQHDLQQMDGAQSSFEEALDTADEIIKEISPHAAVYDDWRKARRPARIHRLPVGLDRCLCETSKHQVATAVQGS